ncbi:MAG: hypothetical protein IM572_06275 [Chitinophagaceae bacterium]|jgi:hypothetical protein|nr:hypothetical protein [Microcystis sp. M065S1]MCA6492264.1 hypothetical protein [Chitinophagaceae bacterium]
MSRLGKNTIPDFAALRFLQGKNEYSFGHSITDVSRKKTIVKTHIKGKTGSVKEMIGSEDYEVTITGVITGENGQYPTQEVDQLKQFLDSNEPINVVSEFLNNKGIFTIVIENFTLPQTAGGISKQEFTINAISDDPIALNII